MSKTFRLFVHDPPQGLDDRLTMKRRPVDKQLVDNGAQGIDIRGGADQVCPALGLFGSHVGGSAYQIPRAGLHAIAAEVRTKGFGQAEVSYFENIGTPAFGPGKMSTFPGFRSRCTIPCVCA